MIQKFRDYQIEWLTNHCDIELEPELEELIVRFLKDTAECFERENTAGVPNTNVGDTISRQEAIDAVNGWFGLCAINRTMSNVISIQDILRQLPSAQSEQTDCEYCHEDSDGFVRVLERNGHAVIHGDILHLKAKGWRGEVKIDYCPMCGRRLTDE